jgi:hypothetical protein
VPSAKSVDHPDLADDVAVELVEALSRNQVLEDRLTADLMNLETPPRTRDTRH